MTDTTDIAALRSKAANVIGLLTAESLTGSFALDSLADVFDDMFRLLEAERQRAERGEAAAGIIQESLIKEREHSANFEREANLYHEKCETAEAEIAALKGDQVPVAVVEPNDNLTVAEIRGDIPRRKAVRELYEGALVLGQELFAAPQKPVTLIPPIYEKSSDFTERHAGWNDCVNFILAQAAGGIVKDGE